MLLIVFHKFSWFSLDFSSCVILHELPITFHKYGIQTLPATAQLAGPAPSTQRARQGRGAGCGVLKDPGKELEAGPAEWDSRRNRTKRSDFHIFFWEYGKFQVDKLNKQM